MAASSSAQLRLTAVVALVATATNVKKHSMAESKQAVFTNEAMEATI